MMCVKRLVRDGSGELVYLEVGDYVLVLIGGRIWDARVLWIDSKQTEVRMVDDCGDPNCHCSHRIYQHGEVYVL